MTTISEADLRRTLRDRGLRVTNQRLVLLEVLRELERHSSVEEVHRAVAERLPALSVPTVYATLDLFEQLGLVRRVATGHGPALYDPVLDGHAHLACRSCGRVEDLPASPDLSGVVDAAAAAGHAPASAEIVVAGACARCWSLRR